MLFGYPPWKARDEAELLRGIKTIPISSILKRNSSNLSSKAIDFLKRTLAYSEEERVGWGELFEIFNQKQEPKGFEQMDKMFHGSSKERARLVSAGSGSSWNPNNQSLTQNQNQSINNVSTKNLGNSPVSNNSKYQSSSMKNVPGMGLSNPNVSGTQ